MLVICCVNAILGGVKLVAGARFELATFGL